MSSIQCVELVVKHDDLHPGPGTLKIAFLGETSHPNAQIWIRALQDAMPCEIVTWSLPSGNGRRHQIGRVLAWLGAVIRMRRLVAGLAPDLVIAYRTTSYGFLGAMSGFHPLVVAAQGESDAWPLDSPLVGFKRWMARVCLRNADLIHAWGAHIAQEQLSLGASPHKILVRPRGVDLSKFYPSPSGPPIDALRLVSTRSLFPEYRHEIILEAVAAVARHGIPIFLDIAGDGVLSERLRSQALSLGISEQVRFHGQIFHDRLPELLRQCNVYVAMPITEGVSASLLEAMASGCYPVVTDLVANRHWITPPTNGDLVRVDDVRTLERVLVNLWTQKDVFARAAAANRRLVQESASLKDNIASFAHEYQRLVVNASASRHV